MLNSAQILIPKLYRDVLPWSQLKLPAKKLQFTCLIATELDEEPSGSCEWNALFNFQVEVKEPECPS